MARGFAAAKHHAGKVARAARSSRARRVMLRASIDRQADGTYAGRVCIGSAGPFPRKAGNRCSRTEYAKTPTKVLKRALRDLAKDLK